jgi:fused signal recognition particle receptor
MRFTHGHLEALSMDPAWLEAAGPEVWGGLVGLLTVVLGLVGWGLRGRKPAQLEDRGAEPPAGGRSRSWFDALATTRSAFSGAFARLLGGGPVDVSALEPLEDALLLADVGPVTTEKLIAVLRERVRGGERDGAALREVLRREMEALLLPVPPLPTPATGPLVILVVGVNGSGKTTTIGKVASQLVREGRSVVVAAGDTYRAAAADQLAVWAERAGAQIVRGTEGADPASVAHQGVEAAIQRGADVLLVDTAGRLQTAKPLMDQLSKVRRVIDKKLPGAPHVTWLVIDGTMGQNALAQARTFHQATPLTGVVVTKLDGTAKGGIILAVSAELGLPIVHVGVGEKVDDLRPFEPKRFVASLLGDQEVG